MVTLQPGDLLFVPRGCPHSVENLPSTSSTAPVIVAVSGNFVDETNATAAANHLRHSALVDPGAADLLRQFVEKRYVRDEDVKKY